MKNQHFRDFVGFLVKNFIISFSAKITIWKQQKTLFLEPVSFETSLNPSLNFAKPKTV